MEQALWRLRQQSRSLRERQADARGVWDDEASRFIEQRFLRPQLDADEEVLSQLELQLADSRRCQEVLDEGQVLGEEAIELSSMCHRELVEATQEMRTARNYVQLSWEAEVRALGQIDATLDAIQRANAVCSGVGRDPYGPAPLAQVAYAPASERSGDGPPGSGPTSPSTTRYEWLASINAPGGPGRTKNCMNCAIAVDDALGGVVHSAAESTRGGSVPQLEERYGGTFSPLSKEQIASELEAAGPGSRGIVFGARSWPIPGHVFNAVNDDGTIRFIDGQTGGDAVFDSSFVATYLLRTN